MANIKKKNVRENRVSTVRVDRHPQDKVHLGNMLTAFQNYITNGFSNENWNQANKNYKWLSLQLFQGDRELLANAWRLAYVNSDVSEIISIVDSVRSRL